MEQTGKSLGKEQARYTRNFDARLCKPRYEIPVGSFVFLRKEKGTAEEPKHQPARVATGPYQVIEVANDNVVIIRGEERERISRDRVGLAPSPMKRVADNSLKGALKSLEGIGATPQTEEEKEEVQKDGVPYNGIRSRIGGGGVHKEKSCPEDWQSSLRNLGMGKGHR